MKIYRKVTIKINTGEILYEDSYDYSGPVAECKGGGGESTTTYTQSPEQAAVYAALLPTIQKLGLAGQQGGNASLYNIPQYPTAPQALSTQSLMPTGDWYKNLSPEIMQGIRAPYEDASQQLTESLGYSAGTPMAGASGALGGAQANFWSKAGTEMGTQAWNMMQPGLTTAWNAQNQQQQQDYSGAQNMWTQQLNQNMMPYSIIPGLTGGTYSNPVVNQGSGGFNSMGTLAGAGLGGYGGYYAGMKIGALGGPAGMAIGAGLGGLLGSGLFG